MNREALVGRINKFAGKVKIMEVCGTHTAAVDGFGLRALLPEGVSLVSGPGCPACVTTAEDIDRLVKLSENAQVWTFGDMVGIPGSVSSLAEARARGAEIKIMYSPFELAERAAQNPKKNFLLAAVGFETTVPVYASLLDTLVEKKISNVKIYTSLKTMPEAINAAAEKNAADAFICPGHVCAVTGYGFLERLCKKHKMPFVAAGFEDYHILAAICEIIRQIESNNFCVKNFYPSVVSKNGNETAQKAVDKYFCKTDAVWRGIGVIKNSGYALRKKFFEYNANLVYGKTSAEEKFFAGCRCAEVLMGGIRPNECGLFGGACRPECPKGACMASGEGACSIYYKGTVN
ncbi:MAG: hydrogenase formation protein HypD [Defluviitaleaceae bacterium]|nr:hydrogenase formation protein HypD [Defluviitaleaceae bacterium]